MTGDSTRRFPGDMRRRQRLLVSTGGEMFVLEVLDGNGVPRRLLVTSHADDQAELRGVFRTPHGIRIYPRNRLPTEAEQSSQVHVAIVPARVKHSYRGEPKVSARDVAIATQGADKLR